MVLSIAETVPLDRFESLTSAAETHRNEPLVDAPLPATSNVAAARPCHARTIGFGRGLTPAVSSPRARNRNRFCVAHHGAARVWVCDACRVRDDGSRTNRTIRAP